MCLGAGRTDLRWRANRPTPVRRGDLARNASYMWSSSSVTKDSARQARVRAGRGCCAVRLSGHQRRQWCPHCPAAVLLRSRRHRPVSVPTRRLGSRKRCARPAGRYRSEAHRDAHVAARCPADAGRARRSGGNQQLQAHERHADLTVHFRHRSREVADQLGLQALRVTKRSGQ